MADSSIHRQLPKSVLFRITLSAVLILGVFWNVGWLASAQSSTLPVDVLLLVDQTGSFADDNATFKNQANTLINALMNVPNLDLRFGLAMFQDYEISPFGSQGDVPYQMIQNLTSNAAAVVAAIQGLAASGGNDGPEAQCAALYQTLTGTGQDTNADGDFADIADIPIGQNAVFRSNAIRFVILWTDAGFHCKGDPGTVPYPDPAPGSWPPTPPRYCCSDPLARNPVASLYGTVLVRVVGIWGSGSDSTDLETFVARTLTFAPSTGIDCDMDGSVDVPSGSPFVCTIAADGRGISEAIRAIVAPVGQPLQFTLEEALRNQAVNVSTFAKGRGPSGDIIGLAVTNQLTEKVRIIVRRGTVFTDRYTGQFYVARTAKEFGINAGDTEQFDGIEAVHLYRDRDDAEFGAGLAVIQNIEFWTSDREEVTDLFMELASTLRLIDEEWLDDDEALALVEDITEAPEFPELRPASLSEGYVVHPEISPTYRRIGDVNIELRWYSTADLDLHVIDPFGDEIYYPEEYRHSPSGGELDRDDRCNPIAFGGPESVYWSFAEAPEGDYWVRIDYYAQCEDEGPTDWLLTLNVDGQSWIVSSDEAGGPLEPGEIRDIVVFYRVEGEEPSYEILAGF